MTLDGLTLLGVTLGSALAGSTVLAARRFGWEPRVYALSLPALPLVYALFAFSVGDARLAGVELLWGLPYLVFGGLAAVRPLGAALIAALWLIHAPFDVFHHHLVDNPGVWAIYPSLCAGYDLVITVAALRCAVADRSPVTP